MLTEVTLADLVQRGAARRLGRVDHRLDLLREVLELDDSINQLVPLLGRHLQKLYDGSRRHRPAEFVLGAEPVPELPQFPPDHRWHGQIVVPSRIFCRHRNH
jgi:hypothetical protein